MKLVLGKGQRRNRRRRIAEKQRRRDEARSRLMREVIKGVAGFLLASVLIAEDGLFGFDDLDDEVQP